MGMFASRRFKTVVRVTIAYAVVGFGLIQGATAIGPAFDLPSWFDRVVILLVAIGFPLAIALAWTFEIHTDGLKPAAPSRDDLAPRGEHGRKGKASATTDAELARDPRSVTVLPLNNLTGDPALDAIADGLSEDLITALTQSALRLHVTARNTSFQYRGKTPDVRDVGRELGVRYVIEGSVQKEAAGTKLTLQLIDAVTGAHLWAASRSTPHAEDLRRHVLRTTQDWRKLLIDELQVALTGTINERALAARPADAKAFGAFISTLPDDHLFVWSFTTRFGGEGDLARRTRESIALAERAVARRPAEARNHAWLAFLLMDEMLNMGAADKRAVRARILSLCEHAIAIDKNDPDVAGFATTALFVSGHFRHAYTLTRSVPNAPPYLRDLLLAIFENDVDGALERTHARVASELAPSDQERSVLAHLYLLRGDYDLAIKWAEEATLLYPDIFIPDVIRGIALVLSGRVDEARRLAARVRARWPRGDFTWTLDLDPEFSGVDPASPFHAAVQGPWKRAVQEIGLAG